MSIEPAYTPGGEDDPYADMDSASTEQYDPEQQPTDTDELVEDAAPVERPEGLPTMVPIAVLNKDRAKRARFWEYAGSDAISALSDSGGDISSLASARHAYKALADMEEALRVVVLQQARPKMEQWLKQADDEDLSNAFSWYMQQMQPGEANALPN